MTEAFHLNEEEEAVIDALRRSPLPLPPGDLAARFSVRATREMSPPVRLHRGPWPWAVAAAIALVLGGGWLIEWQGRRAEVTRLRGELQAAMTDLSTSRRLLVVVHAGSSGIRDRDVVTTLTRVLLNDSSATVRVAAVEALARLNINTLADISPRAVTSERSVFVLTALLDASEQMNTSQRRAVLSAVLAQPNLPPTLRADAQTRISS